MSMKTDIYYGYGIITSKIKIKDVERLKELIHRLPCYEEDVEAYFKAENIPEPTIEDYLSYMEDDNGLAGLLETLVYKEEGISLYACIDNNGEYYLLYPEAYPWDLVELDLSLNEEKLKAIFQKYVALLTDEPIEIDYQRCECYG